MKFKQLLSKRITLIKMILSYVISGSIIIGLFSWATIFITSNNAVNNMKETHKGVLVQAIDTTDATVKHLHHSLIQKVSSSNSDSTLFEAMYSDNFSSLKRWKINECLDEIANSSPLIHSIYLYNSSQGLFFSNNNPVATKDSFFDSEALKIAESHTHLTINFVPREIPNITGGAPQCVISFLVPGAAYSKSDKSALIVNIDQNLFQSTIFVSEDSESDYKVILNSDCRTLAGSQDFGTYQGDFEFIKKIIESSSDIGSFNTILNGKEALISYAKDSTYQWYFIVADYHSKIAGTENSVIRGLLYLSIFFILTSLIFAGFFVFGFYKPVNRLLKRINPKSDTADDKVYDMITNTLDRIENDSFLHERSKKHQFLRSLCCGEITNEYKFNSQLSKINISLIGSNYRVLILYIPLREYEDAQDNKLIRYAVMNIASELLEQAFSLTAFEDEENTVTLILAYDDFEDKIDIFKNLILEINQNLQQYFQFKITTFLGSEVSSFISVSESYKNALSSMEYIFAFDDNQIFIETTETDRYKNQNMNYPIKLEKKIIDAIRACDIAEIENNVKLFIEEIRQFSRSDIVASITLLLTAAYKQSTSFHGEVDYSELFKKAWQMDSPGKLTDWILSLFKDIIDKSNSRKNNRNADLAIAMQNYIDANFTDPALSVDSVAKQVFLSTNYARIIFKEYADVSISNYISNKRFEKACDLLTSTKHPIAKIAQDSGYSATEHFFSIFKRKTGKTPSEYRKSSRI